MVVDSRKESFRQWKLAKESEKLRHKQQKPNSARNALQHRYLDMQSPTVKQFFQATNATQHDASKHDPMLFSPVNVRQPSMPPQLPATHKLKLNAPSHVHKKQQQRQPEKVEQDPTMLGYDDDDLVDGDNQASVFDQEMAETPEYTMQNDGHGEYQGNYQSKSHLYALAKAHEVAVRDDHCGIADDPQCASFFSSIKAHGSGFREGISRSRSNSSVESVDGDNDHYARTDEDRDWATSEDEAMENASVSSGYRSIPEVSLSPPVSPSAPRPQHFGRRSYQVFSDHRRYHPSDQQPLERSSSQGPVGITRANGAAVDNISHASMWKHSSHDTKVPNHQNGENKDGGGDRDHDHGDKNHDGLDQLIGHEVSPEATFDGIVLPTWSLMVLSVCAVVGVGGFLIEDVIAIITFVSPSSSSQPLTKRERQQLHARLNKLQHELGGFQSAAAQIERHAQRVFDQVKQHLDNMRAERAFHQQQIAHEMQLLRDQVLQATHDMLEQEKQVLHQNVQADHADDAVVAAQSMPVQESDMVYVDASTIDHVIEATAVDAPASTSIVWELVGLLLIMTLVGGLVGIRVRNLHRRKQWYATRRKQKALARFRRMHSRHQTEEEEDGVETISLLVDSPQEEEEKVMEVVEVATDAVETPSRTLDFENIPDDEVQETKHEEEDTEHQTNEAEASFPRFQRPEALRIPRRTSARRIMKQINKRR